MSKKGTRISLYISEDEAKLVEWLDSKKNRSSFIMDLIKSEFNQEERERSVSNADILEQLMSKLNKIEHDINSKSFVAIDPSSVESEGIVEDEVKVESISDYNVSANDLTAMQEFNEDTDW